MATTSSRRGFLRLAGGVAAATLFGASDVLAARRAKHARRAVRALPSRTLSFYAVHTGERLSVTYCRGDRYETDALAAVNRLLRDHRTDQVHEIDAALLDQLHRVRGVLDTRDPFHVVCGYRSPETNAALERLRHGGVATHSLHVDGKAIDLFLPDRSLEQLRDVALGLAAGGVGYYPASNFVHLDTGRVRTWVG
jgi:uncharacterized protein YcbK (DUF882 family)